MYNQKKAQLRALLANPAFNQNFPGQRGSLIRQSLNVVFRDLDMLVQGRQPNPGPNEVRLVAHAARIVQEIATYEPLNKYMADLISVYVEVVKNWNAQVVRARDIDLMLDTTARLVAGYMTFLDAINIMRRFVDRFERMMRYTPPSFDLARHYLQLVLKKYERGEPINKYEEAKQHIVQQKQESEKDSDPNSQDKSGKKMKGRGKKEPSTADSQQSSAGSC